MAQIHLRTNGFWRVANNYATITVIGLLSLVSACSHYDFSINDNVVYTPKALFQNYHITDSNLASCIEQTISDNKITRALDLTRLRCTHAGITTLGGIETFYGLIQLDLRDNTITEIKVLEKLSRLEVVLLGNNNISDIAPLLHLLKLVELDLEENPTKDCQSMKQLNRAVEENNGLLLTPPSCTP
ncbi:leucine-rich repeat domain-containing protein [Gilvimarinus polysaccharolyticus]|uniref:leucine-rich repeat domain-containing protein n=1 Tax=Gilvimarinus polysaccharolyticus TaxID=863921 RepID=UPI00067345D5|nr:leucine-rich repeat domain-containing protein [Gilvimarinus polysaccharolyticus]